MLRIAVIAVGVVVSLSAVASNVHARCFCQCVDGRMVPVCDTSSDVRPAACAPSLCPAPLNSGTNAKKCEQRQLCDKLGRCRLREICQ